MNIEATVISYLNNIIGSGNVYAEVPDSPSGEFFVVDKTGSSTENHICTSTIAVQSYADSKAEASDANERIKAIMDGIVELDSIGACYLDTDYNFANVARKQHRYQAIFRITHY